MQRSLILGQTKRELGTIDGTLPDLSCKMRDCIYEPRCLISSGKEICKKEVPAMSVLSATGKVVCHFLGELNLVQRIDVASMHILGYQIGGAKES